MVSDKLGLEPDVSLILFSLDGKASIDGVREDLSGFYLRR